MKQPTASLLAGISALMYLESMKLLPKKLAQKMVKRRPFVHYAASPNTR